MVSLCGNATVTNAQADVTLAARGSTSILLARHVSLWAMVEVA